MVLINASIFSSGKIQAKDVTEVLKSQGYWSSYNSPYFKDIFEASGSPKMVEKYGEFYSYEGTARAKIFARDQGILFCWIDICKLDFWKHQRSVNL